MESKKNRFISGVVEGFYGKPWTKDQRVTLFERLRIFGLTSYMYAPKDDCKHRKDWRDQYIETEKENLKALIKSAESNSINFIYALSPGVDIVFSCPKDVELLKQKMKQVADLGCKYFALLFDDIEPELSLPDKQDFDSFADAQCQITNQIYQHIGKPEVFLFCPTEYCTTRAKPSVEKSEYLKVLGKSLHENIDILWTGPKVVSQQISVTSIEAVAKVLRRKPVIWDNIHANDYDQRRVFLGPFDGRPASLYNHVNGILTNPNCEYECNFIALHTLATWIKRCEGNKGKSIVCKKADSSDEMCIDEEMRLDNSKADPTADTTEPMEVATQREIPCDKTCDSGSNENKESMDIADVTGNARNNLNNLNSIEDARDSSCSSTLSSDSVGDGYDPKVALRSAVHAWLQEFKKSRKIPKAVMGFSSSPSKIDVSDGTNSLMTDVTSADNRDQRSPGEKSKLSCDAKEDASIENDNEETQCCRHHSPVKGQNSSPKKKAKRSDIDHSDLLLLSDLFFLPYEHGEKAKRLISEFKWLKQNAPPIESVRKKDKIAQEWEKRASSYHDHCEAVLDLFHRLSHAPNQQLVQEIYPYIWDVKEVVMLLNAFVKWLGSKDKKCKEGSDIIPQDPEPWMFRGGIAEELERLLPIDGGSDILSRKPPPVITQEIYTIRPYLDSDKVAIYELCRQLHDDKHNLSNLFSRHPELAGDKYIGAYLQHSRGLTFVVEGEHGLCGYCIAAADTKAFYKNYKDWLSTISNKYERPTGDPDSWSTEDELIESIYNPLCYLPKELYTNYPAHISINMLSNAKSTNIGKRLLACLISVIKAEGIPHVYTEVSSRNLDAVSFYKELGFREIALNKPFPDNITILGRSI